MKKKALSNLLAALLIAGMLTGCGSQPGSGSGSDGSAGGKESGSSQAAESGKDDSGQPGGTEEAADSGDVADLSSLTFGPYDWPVAENLDYSEPYNKRFDGMEFTRIVNTGTAELPDGMTVDENTITWIFESITGLKPKALWSASGDAFSQKQSQAIASGEIPDFMTVSMTQYYMLVKSGLIADLTHELREGNHPTIQKLYEAGGNQALDVLEVDGRIYGIPLVGAQFDGSPLIWIRKDWMEKLNLETPKSLADLEEIAKAFMEKDPDGNGQNDTYGIPVRASFDASYGGDGNLCDIFLNVGGAAPGIWQKQEDGTVIYGSLMEGAKEALSFLNSWYEQGIIPSDFATWDADTLNQAVGDDKAGIVFSPWWGTWSSMNNSINLNASAEWSAYMLSAEEGGEICSAAGNPVQGIFVVNKNFEDPSAFVYAYDMYCLAGYDLGEREGYVEINNAYNIMNGSVPGNAYILPIQTIMEKVVDTGEMTTIEEVKEYCKNEAGVALDWIVEGAFKGKTVYDALQEGKNPREAVYEGIDATTTYQQYMQWWEGPNALLKGNPRPVSTVFQGSTESMELYGSFLSTMEQDAYVNMIMGNTDGKSISDYFDDFVQSYLDQGGAEITAEVQETIGG